MVSVSQDLKGSIDAVELVGAGAAAIEAIQRALASQPAAAE